MSLKQILFAGLAMAVGALADAGDSGKANPAVANLRQMSAHRVVKDFSLKARLWTTRDVAVPVDLLVKNTPQETRSVYRSGNMELLVVQPVTGAPRFFLHGAGELKGERLQERWLGSAINYWDLGFGFLQWPNPASLAPERMRGRNCDVIELKAPAGSAEPYARVKVWVDKEYGALLRTEAYDEYGQPAKRIAVTSFKKIGEVWIPRSMEFGFVPAGQVLPSQEKSRLEVYEGDYEKALPAEWFAEEKFQ